MACNVELDNEWGGLLSGFVVNSNLLMMSWQLLLAISILSYSVALLLQRSILKDQRIDPITCTVIVQLTAGLSCGLFAFVKKAPFPDLQPFWPNLALMVCLYAASNILTYKALTSVEASTFTIIISTRAIWSIVAAVLLLSEAFSLRQIIGTLLIIASVLLVSWKGQKMNLGKGELMALLAALAFGVEFINDAYLVSNLDFAFYLTLAFILPAIAIWLIFPKTTLKMKGLRLNKEVWKLLFIGILFALSAACMFLAYQQGRSAARIASINEASTIVVVVLATIFLKERSRLIYKLIAAVMSVLGVILVK